VHDPHYLQRRRGGSVDYLGVILLMLWLGLMQIVADRGQRADWFAAPWVMWSSAVSGLSLLLIIFTSCAPARRSWICAFSKTRSFPSPCRS